MKLDVSKIVKAEGASLPVSVEISFDVIEFNGQEFSFAAPMKVEGNIRNAGGNLYLEADVQALVRTGCARCLKELEVDFAFAVDEVFSQEEPDGDSEFLPIVSNTVDIKSAVEENFCTSVPIVFLCSEDCKGLCHSCGKDLNEGPCDCEKDEIDPRLAGLKAFLKND